ncbi:MAG: TonB-dependent receptor, partial [Phycisphaerae bacterium]|nr:TonB-dependent receptor [Phycisphaerae bacterium]
RNEGDIFVRGFNRFQVPLYMDGVRVYLPADNRIDMNRFLTPDLAEVQVAKGYVSVLNGPGGMGGAINLVSRKPTKELEFEGRSGMILDGDLGSMGQWSSYAYAGTRQKGYYAQVSYNIVDQDHFDLSNDFSPSPFSQIVPPMNAPFNVKNFPYEQGGNRDHSDFQDWRVNAKIGITPNKTDEYSVNYTNQESKKAAPLSVDRQVVQGFFNPGFTPTLPIPLPPVLGLGSNSPRYWYWPNWDNSSLSWLSKTQLGDASYIKTNAYFNRFQNTISFFADQTYTNQPVDSPYDDHSLGGFVEMGTNLIPMNTLKAAIHYRKDVHTDQNINYTYPAVGPRTFAFGSSKRLAEETWSFAAENTFHATKHLDIVGGVSYDINNVLTVDPALNVGSTANPIFPPLPSAEAWNWQTAAIYSYSPTGKVHADVSSRTRFPTLFERYSTRFDSKAVVDPNVQPERATNYEIGVDDTLFRTLHIASAVFYSDIQDSIQNAFVGPNGQSTTTGAVALVGISPKGDYWGVEFSADWDVSHTLRLGGNYTYMQRHLDYVGESLNFPVSPVNQRLAVASNQLEGTPLHKAFLYAAWKATNRLTLTPSLELASDRVALVTSCASTLIASSTSVGTSPNSANGNCNVSAANLPPSPVPNYVDIGAYALLNFNAEYAFDKNTTVAVGATNLLDQDYQLAQGFPEAGRMFYANARVRF